MSKRSAMAIKKTVKANPQPDAALYIKNIAFWGICLMLFLAPFFRGLFFPEDQQKALLVIVFLFWIVCLHKWLKGDQKLFSSPMDYLVLAFPIAYIVSFFNAVNVGFALDEIVKALLYFFVYWILVNSITKDEDFDIILKTIIFTAVAVSFVGLATAGGLITIKDGFAYSRFSSSFQYPNALSSYLIVSMFFSLHVWGKATGNLLLKEVDKAYVGNGILLHIWNNYAYAVSTYIILLVLVGTKSYGGFIISLLCILLFFIGLTSEKRLLIFIYLITTGAPAAFCSYWFLKEIAAGKNNLAWISVLVGLLFVLLMLSIYYAVASKGSLAGKLNMNYQYVIMAFILMVLVIVVVGSFSLGLIDIDYDGMLAQLKNKVAYSAVDRFYFQKDALKMVIERPIIGWGGGGWKESYKMFQGFFYNSNEVHGHYVQVLVETGVTGFLIVASIWGVFIFLTVRALRLHYTTEKRGLVWTVFTAAVSLGIYAIIDFNLSLSAIALVLWSLWAMMSVLASVSDNYGKLLCKGEKVKKPTVLFALSTALCLFIFIMSCSLIAASNSQKRFIRYLQAGDMRGAILSAKEATQYNPYNPRYNSDLSYAYRITGDVEKSVAEAELAIQKSKHSSPMFSILSDLYNSTGNFEKAVEAAENAVKYAPFEIQWYNLLSRAYFVAGFNLNIHGEREGAKRYLMKANQVEEMIERQVKKIGTLEQKLWIYAPMMGQTEYTSLYAGASLGIMGEYDKAEKKLFEVKGNDKIEAEALLWLSYIYKKQGRFDEYNNYYNQAKSIVPDIERRYSSIVNLINT